MKADRKLSKLHFLMWEKEDTSSLITLGHHAVFISTVIVKSFPCSYHTTFEFKFLTPKVHKDHFS